MQIKPVSDLRNKFPEIEAIVNEGQPVFLTKNGYGTMVVLSIEQYTSLTDPLEAKLDKADMLSSTTDKRLLHDTIFQNVRSSINEK